MIFELRQMVSVLDSKPIGASVTYEEIVEDISTQMGGVFGVDFKTELFLTVPVYLKIITKAQSKVGLVPEDLHGTPFEGATNSNILALKMDKFANEYISVVEPVVAKPKYVETVRKIDYPRALGYFKPEEQALILLRMLGGLQRIGVGLDSSYKHALESLEVKRLTEKVEGEKYRISDKGFDASHNAFLRYHSGLEQAFIDISNPIVEE